MLHPGAAITGTVTDALGNPVAGVSVYGSPAYPYEPSDVGNFSEVDQYLYGQTTSAPDGSFLLKGLYPDVTQACFDPTTAGHLLGLSRQFGYFVQCEDTPYSVHPGHLTDTGTTKLDLGRLGGTLTGVAYSPTGDPVPGVIVTVAPAGHRYAITATSTDSTGRYSISALKAGTYRICVWSNHTPTPQLPLGYVSGCRQRTGPVSVGQAAHANVVARPGGAFTGVVRASDGTPVADAYVFLVTRNTEAALAATDGRGRFTVVGLRSGRYRVCVDTTSTPVRGFPNGVRSACYGDRSRFVVRRGKLRIGIDFSLRPGAAIRGTVLAGAGHPARWVGVYTSTFNGQLTDLGSDAFAVTGRHGHFKLVGLRPGRYQLCFDNGALNGEPRTGCPHRTARARAGDVANFGTMDMGPSGSILATVTDSDGHLLNGADVTALVPCHGYNCAKSPLFGAERFRVAASWTTYGNGTVPLTDLKPGTYAVCVFGYLAAPRSGAPPATGYADHCTSTSFDVAVQGGRATKVSVALPLAGEVTGTVTDTKGKPIRHVVVKVSNSAAADVTTGRDFFGFDPPAEAAVTAADGTYAVRSVAAGDQTVCFNPHTLRWSWDFLNQCYGGQPGKKGGIPVPVTSGQMTSGVDIALSRVASAGTTTRGIDGS